MHFFRPSDPWRPAPFVVPVPVDPTGLAGPTKAQARGPHWRRTGRSRYVPSAVDATRPEQRIVEAAGLLGGRGGLTGWPALRLRGGRYFDGLHLDRRPRAVPLALGPHNGRRDRPGVRLSYDRLDPVVSVRGLPCLPTPRALFDEMRFSRRLFDAVVAMDMAALSRLTSIEEMAEYVEGMAGWAGVPLVRRALELADPHSASPPETRLRLFWQHTLRMPRPLANVGVFDLSGDLLGYPDLLDVEAGLVIEYDGVDHLPEGRQSKDVDREGGLRDVGLEVVRVVALDLRHPKQLAERLRRARQRSRFAAPTARRWTLEPDPPPRYCPRSCSCRSGQLSGQ